MDIQLTVESSTKTENNNYCNKLIAESSVETPFGNANSRQTFYMFTDKENKKGVSAKMDLDAFDVVEKDYINPETNESMRLKYIYPKRG